MPCKVYRVRSQSSFCSEGQISTHRCSQSRSTNREEFSSLWSTGSCENEWWWLLAYLHGDLSTTTKDHHRCVANGNSCVPIPSRYPRIRGRLLANLRPFSIKIKSRITSLHHTHTHKTTRQHTSLFSMILTQGHIPLCKRPNPNIV